MSTCAPVEHTTATTAPAESTEGSTRQKAPWLPGGVQTDGDVELATRLAGVRNRRYPANHRCKQGACNATIKLLISDPLHDCCTLPPRSSAQQR